MDPSELRAPHRETVGEASVWKQFGRLFHLLDVVVADSFDWTDFHPMFSVCSDEIGWFDPAVFQTTTEFFEALEVDVQPLMVSHLEKRTLESWSILTQEWTPLNGEGWMFAGASYQNIYSSSIIDFRFFKIEFCSIKPCG